jgi:4-amino-4-deoxy-L-arabinose transferase-like glycosyltransferase
MDRRYYRLFLLILLVYLILGAGYALLTPLWQAPDEPAHFNNIAHIARTGSLPLLQPGDYDQAYLEKLKSEGFPPELSIEPVRYEGHQPPLYYLLMTPLLWLLQGAGLQLQVWGLRLANVGVGVLVLLFIWLSARRLFPKRPQIALLAAGFAAFLPMHIAMSASINNDALAELFIAAVMFRLLGVLREGETSPGQWAVTGLLIGLGLLTKFQAYILIPLAGAVWLWQLWRGWRQHRLSPGLWLSGAALALPALLLPLPWWLRNMAVYGPLDPFGLNRHNAVVVGQPRTADWIAAHGWAGYLDRFITFTFQSFWGVFGWMGVFMDARIYLFLALLSLLILTGVVFAVVRWRQGSLMLSAFQKRGLWLLLMQLGLVAAAYLWYNLDFVQHQGRYFFPALLSISVFAAGGLLMLFSPEGSRWGGVVALMLLGYWLGVGLASGDLNKWALLLSGGAAAVLFLRAFWLHKGDAFWWAVAVEGLMALIALYALFGAVLPQLG